MAGPVGGEIGFGVPFGYVFTASVEAGPVGALGGGPTDAGVLADEDDGWVAGAGVSDGDLALPTA
jgi:hypothetical protein